MVGFIDKAASINVRKVRSTCPGIGLPFVRGEPASGLGLLNPNALADGADRAAGAAGAG